VIRLANPGDGARVALLGVPNSDPGQAKYGPRQRRPELGSAPPASASVTILRSCIGVLIWATVARPSDRRLRSALDWGPLRGHCAHDRPDAGQSLGRDCAGEYGRRSHASPAAPPRPTAARRRHIDSDVSSRYDGPARPGRCIGLLRRVEADQSDTPRSSLPTRCGGMNGASCGAIRRTRIGVRLDGVNHSS
jgi:hypothetical protein